MATAVPVVLLATIEGELRDIARDLRSNGAHLEADRLENLIRRYSGIKPLRAKVRP